MIGSMDAGESSDLPIFELPLAILPGERAQLHIFEDRYKRMIGHCIDTGHPFVIVYRDDEGARPIGCAVTVSEVLERFEDGRLDIVVLGAERLRVLDRFEAPGWPAGTVEPLGPPPATTVGAGPLQQAREAFAELLTAVGADPERAASAADAYEIAGQVEMPASEKQSLLESDAEERRLELLTKSLRGLLGGVQRSRELAERARTNGHGPPPRA